MSTLNKVDVVIGGEIITLISSEHEDYMQRLARYIDRKLSEIKASKSGATLNEHMNTLLIAANIADDYFKSEGKLQRLTAEHKKYVAELGKMQQENDLLTEQLHLLQNQLNQSRAELEEYIENFDKDKPQPSQEGNIVSMNPRAANGFGK